MTATVDSRRCGRPVHRCRGCDMAVAKPLTVCPKCGSTDIDLNATCQRPLGPEVKACYFHGGNAPQVIAARDRRIARRAAEGQLGRILEDMGEPADAPHPLEGLPDAYGRAWLMVTALDQLTRDLDSPLGVNRHDEQVPHPLMVMHGEWLDRWARIQKIALDAGLDVRRQTLAEAEVDRLFGAVSQAMTVIPADMRESFRSALAASLRGGQPATVPSPPSTPPSAPPT